MAEAVQTPPSDLGYGFTTWSVSRLAAHLKKVTKVGFSEDQLRRLLHQEGFSVQRPKHTLKGKRDEAEFQRARGELEALKKGHCGPAPPRR
jgi:transposase